MNNKQVSYFAILMVLAILLMPTIITQQAHTEAKYSAKVPDFVTTPDKVETKTLGTLEFFDGMPTRKRCRKPTTILI
jgi:hypothetical protein